MEKAQRNAKATRAALVATGRRLFVDPGFYETTTEQIVNEAGVGTRGALYHHFEDKQALFQAVFEEVLEDYAARPTTPSEFEGDPLERIRIGVQRFLDAATEPEVQRIVLIDGPTVLGWDTLRALEEHTVVNRSRAMIEDAIAAGVIPDQPADPLARLLLAAVREAGLMASRADQETAAQIRLALDRMVLGFR